NKMDSGHRHRLQQW
ncbi:hypothetical protein D039_3959B, partial [Vibrio parahaemolyticus EKP-028]